MSPFVQQQDTAFSVPFLTLSINNFYPKEKQNMPNDNLDLFEPNDEINDTTLPDTDVDTDLDDGTASPPIPGSKKSTFVESQLAKTIFDGLGIDPDDFTEESDLISELNLRLVSMLTIQGRLLAALDIDAEDKNKFELLTTKVTALVEFLDQYDHDDDGIVDEEDIQQGAQPTGGDGDSDDDDTIDGTLNQLEANDKTLQLSLGTLQRKYDQSAVVIKALVAKNRRLELDNMLQAGEINKGTHQKAVKKFVLKLSLNDGFDDFIDGAKTNSHRISVDSKTLPQQASAKIDPTASWANVAMKISAPYGREELEVRS
jgi:hypothetical protein